MPSASHSQNGLSRRRFFTLASAACLTAAAPAAAFRWQGVALGAKAQIILDHPNAEAITRKARQEIDRLEDIFSLYRTHSQIKQLNVKGALAAPAFELLECLSLAGQIHRASEGRFDPTVQPLWQVYAQAVGAGLAPAQDDIAAARQLLGFETVAFDSAEIRLRPGQALTLNGIAQGYIADRVADLMRREGIDDVVIDTGEIYAMGGAKGADTWPIGIVGDAGKRRLSNRGLATSAALGTLLAADGSLGHILDPRSGGVGQSVARQVSISAPKAALADGLSTALVLTTSRGEAESLLSGFDGVQIESYQI